MAAAPSPRLRFRTAEYWENLGVIADSLINESERHTPHPYGNAAGALRKLSSQGFGALSLFDLCTLLLLAAPRPPAELCGSGDHGPRRPQPVEPKQTALVSGPVTELTRGPVTVAAHPTARHVQHLRELEAAVAEAMQISPQHPRARSAVRRALMARGSTVHDATAIYGMVCETIA
ncbi:hypothetical protein [Streptomyces sp. NPDC002215]|uniref:hypothetical protein n=1 Tax=Streptomyces sp. NPDC002215 TaxID=3154412 RepID=UPI00331CB8FB